VQTVAPFNHRVEEIMARHKLPLRVAQNRVRASDRARFDYLRRYHDAHWLDSTLYHLVLNADRLPAETATDLIIAAQRAMKQPVDTDRADY
jgi:cytidylate kinase